MKYFFIHENKGIGLKSGNQLNFITDKDTLSEHINNGKIKKIFENTIF